jgi:Ca2+-binding EF-hand superfamily protein
MGNENDKRINKQNNPSPQPQNVPAQNVPGQNMNTNPQQNANPYPQQNQMKNASNNNNNNTLPAFTRSLTQRRKNTVTKKMLKDAFKTYSVDGSYLNRQRFNDAIESIFRFDIPEMHYTHLCNKIFELLDSSGDGKIQEDEFLEGLGKVLKDRNVRFLLSMMAMMTGDTSRDFIELREIKEFFYLSYIEAFKHLGWQIKRNKDEFKKNNLPFATIQQLGKWAEKYKKEIESNIDRDLHEFDRNINDTITFEQFIRWISTDHTIYVQYGNKNIKIATSLTDLDKIYYDETVDASNTGGPYPSI